MANLIYLMILNGIRLNMYIMYAIILKYAMAYYITTNKSRATYYKF